MKESVGKLSRGIIEYNGLVLGVSVSDIKQKLVANTVHTGSFSVYSEDDRDVKGIIYSTNSVVRLINNQFSGQISEIKYEINTAHMGNDEHIDGKFVVVSNGGEAIIAYDFIVENVKAEASIGEINDLFNFTNLVKTDYDEALRLFVSPDFPKIFLSDNIVYQGIYDGLIKSANVKSALEEFIVAINKKNKISISISDLSREYENLTENYADIITISKDSWGYVDIKVDVQGDFITNYKSHITSDDFAGSNYEFTYLINTECLHDGMNYATITFSNIFQIIDFRISVDNTHEHDIGEREVKRCLVELMNMYFDFRSRRYSVDAWSEKSLALIERARGFSDDNDFLRLVQAQICLTRNRDDEVEWLLESVAEHILDDIDNNLELYCYYLYIRTLQKRDGTLTGEMFDKIRSYYENGYDSWRILWILLYLDDAYENNASLKLARIKEQYKKGCNSPLMYYEALSVFNRQPALLRVINSFELQVILFGCRHDMVDIRLAKQVAELAMLEKSFRPLMFRILTSLYNKYKDLNILTSVCSILIRGNITNEKYFKWYEEGVRNNINLTRLYEYYVFSAPEDIDEVFPNIIYMYFVYNGNLLFQRESYLYANIIKNKDRIPNIYKSYKHNMENFAIDNLIHGRMDRYLAVIYREFLHGSLIKDEIAHNLPHILATYEVKCDNDNIQRIIVIHKELLSEQGYILRNGRADVEIFTEDAIILAEDLEGNRHIGTIDMDVNKLLDNNSLLQLCDDKCNDDIYYVAMITEQFIRYHSSQGKTVDTFRNIMNMKEFRYAYRCSIMKDVIEYYYNNYDGDELDEYLIDIDISRLDADFRDKVLELMIMRGLYQEAYAGIKEYGYERLSSRRLVKFVSRYIMLVSEDEDELIINVSAHCFRKGKYNETVLEYLCKYYNGITKEMIDLWKTAKDFEFESRELEERLIAQILFGRVHTGYLPEIYDSYVRKGASEMIMKAYFFYMSYCFFVREKPVGDLFFGHLEHELIVEEYGHDILHEVCKAAYLQQMSTRATLTDRQKELCSKCVENLSEKGYEIACYKKLGKWISLPGTVNDKVVIEYRTSPECNVTIHYIMAGNENDSEYTECRMKQIFGGVYTMEFTIFCGENIQYYITEETEKGTGITESSNYYLEDDVLCTDATAYGMLNDILRCKEIKDEATVRELTRNYYMNRQIVSGVFDIL